MISDTTRARWREKLATIKQAVLGGKYKLSSWESAFCASIDKALSENRDITMQQSIALDGIYRKVLKED